VAAANHSFTDLAGYNYVSGNLSGGISPIEARYSPPLAATS